MPVNVPPPTELNPAPPPVLIPGGGTPSPATPPVLVAPVTPPAVDAPPVNLPLTPPTIPAGTQWATKQQAENGGSSVTMMSPARTLDAILANAVTPSTERAILLGLGDSVMAPNPLAGGSFWLNKVAARCERFRGALILDEGIPGNTIQATVALIDDIVALYLGVNKQTRKISFLGTVLNDIANGRTPAQALASMKACCVKLRQAGFLVVAFSCPIVNAWQASIEEYNELLRASVLAGEFDFLVDIARLPYTTTEYVHPDDPGAEMIADETIRTLSGFPKAAASSVHIGLKTSHAITAIGIGAAAPLTWNNHGLTNGQFIHVTGSNCTPSIDGIQRVTVTGPNTFTVPVTTTVAGTAATINTGVARIAADINYGVPHTWMIHTINDNGNGANIESFFASSGYRAGSPGLEMKWLSAGMFNGGYGETSPIFDTGYFYHHPLVDWFFINKSTQWTYRIFKNLLGSGAD